MDRSRRALIEILLAVVATAAFWSNREARADSMRCGQRIVSTGDSLYVVRSICGEPAAKRRRFETRTEQRRVIVDCGTSKTPHRRCERIERVARQVQIDEWTYDFGPRRFTQILTFGDGLLERVEAGGRGGPESPRTDATPGLSGAARHALVRSAAQNLRDREHRWPDVVSAQTNRAGTTAHQPRRRT